ncbi:MAG TPA: GNAT family protein [Pseudonocardiaceae bacterium]|jgi:RimJ/RimL family protein N-acetyltransferase|nr:GNAT family protein [Pseudonocardiaceae bacterium]
MLALKLSDDAELRALEPWQAGEFAAHVAAAREHLAPWIPWATTVVDDDTAATFLQRYADEQARGNGRILGIWLDGTLMGGTLFRVWDSRSGNCEIGVWLDPAAVGRGLITAAATAMIDWAFRIRGMSRVEWLTFATNTRSIAVARRLGMTREGLLRQAFPHNGDRHDVEIWAVLATEWPRVTGLG